MRVSFDLESESGIRNYGQFVERAADLVVSYRRLAFPASMATDNPAALCFPKCSVPT